jgi:hypothetical protein
LSPFVRELLNCSDSQAVFAYLRVAEIVIAELPGIEDGR